MQSDENEADMALTRIIWYSRNSKVFLSVFVTILNAHLKGRQLQTIAQELDITPALLSHYRTGRRIPPINLIPQLAKTLDLIPELEEYLVVTWRYDKSIEKLGEYANTVQRIKAYDRVVVIERWLEVLCTELTEARDRVRFLSPTSGD